MADTPVERLIIARLAGTAARHARHADQDPGRRREAVIELAEIAAGWGDLLAEVAGVGVGFCAGSMDEAVQLRAAQLCIEAGADTGLIEHWIQEGRYRAGQGRLARSRP
jgi:hypothetical protein